MESPNISRKPLWSQTGGVNDFSSSKPKVLHPVEQSKSSSPLPKGFDSDNLQGTNISHVGKRKIIFKSALVRDNYVSPQECIILKIVEHNLTEQYEDTAKKEPYFPQCDTSNVAKICNVKAF